MCLENVEDFYGHPLFYLFLANSIMYELYDIWKTCRSYFSDEQMATLRERAEGLNVSTIILFNNLDQIISFILISLLVFIVGIY
jgi:hypothetical protein